MTDKYVRHYCSLTDKSLHEIYIPTEAVSCKNVHCSVENHIDAINILYSDIVNSLIQPGEQIMQNDLDGLSMLMICMIPLEKLDNNVD